MDPHVPAQPPFQPSEFAYAEADAAHDEPMNPAPAAQAEAPGIAGVEAEGEGEEEAGGGGQGVEPSLVPGSPAEPPEEGDEDEEDEVRRSDEEEEESRTDEPPRKRLRQESALTPGATMPPPPSAPASAERPSQGADGGGRLTNEVSKVRPPVICQPRARPLVIGLECLTGGRGSGATPINSN